MAAAFCWFQAEVLHRLAHSVDDTKACGFCPPDPPPPTGLPVMTPGYTAGDAGYSSIISPSFAGICCPHRRGDVLAGTNVAPHGAHKPAQAFFLANREGRGVNNHAAFPPPKGISATAHFQVIHITPGAPCRWSRLGENVSRLYSVRAHRYVARKASNAGCTVIHTHRDVCMWNCARASAGSDAPARQAITDPATLSNCC